MTRRKGERTDKHRNQSHPFQVEIQIPVGGLGCAYDIMYRWAAWHDHATTSGSSSMSWCFCRREVADAFAADFGGKRVDMPVDLRWLKIDRPDEKELQRRAQAATFGIEKVTGGRRISETGEGTAACAVGSAKPTPGRRSSPSASR